jgi:hypothetical protein
MILVLLVPYYVQLRKCLISENKCIPDKHRWEPSIKTTPSQPRCLLKIKSSYVFVFFMK